MTFFTQNELEDSINLALDADLMWSDDPEIVQKVTALRANTTIEGIEFASKIEPLILPF